MTFDHESSSAIKCYHDNSKLRVFVTFGEKVEIIRLFGNNETSRRQVDGIFNEIHRDRALISHNTVAKIYRLFVRTGVVSK